MAVQKAEFTEGTKVTIRGEQGVGVVTDYLPNSGGLYRVVRERVIGGRVERVATWEYANDLTLWDEPRTVECFSCGATAYVLTGISDNGSCGECGSFRMGGN